MECNACNIKMPVILKPHPRKLLSIGLWCSKMYNFYGSFPAKKAILAEILAQIVHYICDS